MNDAGFRYKYQKKTPASQFLSPVKNLKRFARKLILKIALMQFTGIDPDAFRLSTAGQTQIKPIA
jgi:hypothetical protein